MAETDNISTFYEININIKRVLCELEEDVANHLCLDNSPLSKNNFAFIEMLDQMLELHYSLEEIKNNFLAHF